MKQLFTFLLFAVMMTAMVTGASAQVTIYNWNFNTVDTTGAGDWSTPLASSTGSGSLAHEFVGVRPFAGSTINAEPGDPSGSAFCPQGGTATVNNGKSFTLTVPTTGYVGIILSYATRNTSTGFQSHEIQYSTDGTTFITDTTVTGFTTTFDQRVVNLSDITGANNNPNFKIKIIVDGASSPTGNCRFDNVKIQGYLPIINDGDGTATVLNNAGTFSGSTIFARNTGGQTVLVSVAGVPSGTLTSVRLNLPGGWSGLSAPNVTLGGAFTSLTPAVTSSQITITGATLGTTPGTIQITGLTSDNPVGPLNSGNSTWLVETAKSGGTLTAIASSPKSNTIIPIQNIRTGGVDGFGNTSAAGDTSALNGQFVAVQGVATVQNVIISSNASQTSFFIQSGGYGIQIFRAAAPTVTWVRGDEVVVKGTIETFDGNTEVVPQTGAAPNFYNLGAGVLPAPQLLANAAAITEAVEGKLVNLSSVSWNSAGLIFTDTSSALRSNFTTGADTGTIFLSSTNNIKGSTIPASSPLTGIVYHRKTLAGAKQYKVSPRDLVDLGSDPADGTGTASIVPVGRFASQVAVAETLTVTGDGVHTLGGVSVTIPSSWTWDGTSYAISGTGFSGASSAVTGDGSGGNPWVITVSSAAVTNANTGVIRMFNLNTPGSTGNTTFTTKTRGAGSLANIAAQPTVNISSGFEAIATGNWSSPATWLGGVVPTAGDDVSMTTLGVTVTIDIDGAVCNNLAMTGSGSASNSGPVLQFDATGIKSLTVNGNLTVGGGSGGGSGDRGGRPKLWDNGNNTILLTVKKNITNTSSNSTGNGNAGISMNLGIVRMTGTGNDTLTLGAGMRLGSLEVGDGSSAKVVRTRIISPATSARLAVVSLNIKNNATLWIGVPSTTSTLTVGNAVETGVPVMSGGILVENGGALRAQESSSGVVVADVNVNGGSITNHGTIDLIGATSGPELTGCYYNLRIGGQSAGTSGGTVTLGGTNVGTYANVTIDSAKTLTLNQDMTIGSPFKMTIARGTLAETAGNTVIGTVEATRTVPISTLESFGGIGVEINASGAAPGSTVVTRKTGSPVISGGSQSISRYFDITPTTNTGLNATLNVYYDESELNGNAEATLQLYKSTNAGTSWSAQGGTATPALNRIQLTGVGSLSRWTAADDNNPLGQFTVLTNPIAGWNIIANPVSSPIPGDSVRQLFNQALFAYAFKFVPGTGYQQEYTMANGLGYWEKFPASPSQVGIQGTPLNSLAVPVVSGWNLIGSISVVVDTAYVNANSGGIVTSAYYGFNGSYGSGDAQLVPGKGYWVKTNAAGTLNLGTPGPTEAPAKAAGSAVNPLDEFSEITITDSRGISQTLYLGEDKTGEFPVSRYEMPPQGPEGAFDVRFDSQRMVEVYAERNNASYPVRIASAQYPLTVSWTLRGAADRVFTLNDGASITKMQATGHATLKHAAGQLVISSNVADIPTEFSLSQNYPNPFNPATTIRFGLPQEARVTLRVFNLLGQQVAELSNGVMESGYHDFVWNGKTSFGVMAGSGVYFYKIDATATATGKNYSEVRKMVLLK